MVPKASNLTLLFVLLHLATCKLTCRNDAGEPVDMYILYKFPRLDESDVPSVRSGYGYAYMDATDYKFHLSKHVVSDNTSAPALTLEPVYTNAKTKNVGVAHVFYNDENPDGSKYFTCGHTKGALAFDGETGFWLINSVPKFPPPANEGYGYPHTGAYYGQMFQCVTFNASAFDSIGIQMRYDNPHIHDANLPPSLAALNPNMEALVQGKMIKKAPYCHAAELTSLGGVHYTHFGKANGFHADLYHDFVAKSLQADLLTETWQHDRSKVIGPSCDGYTVEDVTYMSVNMNEADVSFDNYKDHTKFAIGKTEEDPYVCIGDINRETSQYHRGGGTLCTKNLKLWETFRSAVRGVYSCSK